MRGRSLFGRLLVTYTLIIIVTIAVLAVTMTQIIRWSTINQEQDRLQSAADSVAMLYEESYASKEAGEELQRGVQQIAETGSAAIWVTDVYGITRLAIGSDTADTAYIQQSIEAMEEKTLGGEETYWVQYAPGESDEPLITVGMPVMVEGRVIGAAFAFSRITSLKPAMALLFHQVLISAVISALLAFALVFVAARRIERPLAEINLAVKELAGCNFKKRLNIEDSSEVGQLADSFNQMAEALEKYENTRQSFVANVSHELRSPLTSIQGFVQGILDGAIEPQDERQYLEIVLSETKRLNILITDLLDLAKIESGQFPLNRTAWDVNELIRQCIIRFIGKIEEKELELDVDMPEDRTVVFADQDRITQVLTNIMDNAVKYSGQGGSMKIWEKIDGGRAIISISNTGKAIPAADLPFVFDRFFKVDKSHNRKTPGTGIGLSIVKNIIRQHGEEIWVNSEEGTGTVFSFTLSLHKGVRKKAK